MCIQQDSSSVCEMSLLHDGKMACIRAFERAQASTIELSLHEFDKEQTDRTKQPQTETIQTKQPLSRKEKRERTFSRTASPVSSFRWVVSGFDQDLHQQHKAS